MKFNGAAPREAGKNPEVSGKRDLQKSFLYRNNGVPTYGRVSLGLFNPFGFEAANTAQSFSGAAFGVDGVRAFSGYNLLDQVPAVLAVHFSSAGAGDTGVLNGLPSPDPVNLVPPPSFLSSDFATPAGQLPATFRQFWFSWACDWDRREAFNLTTRENNFLRAALGTQSHNLAVVGGLVWDFSTFGGGAPLADTMTLGWQSQKFVPRFQSILGDPTLRLFRVTPPQNLRQS